MTKWLLIDDLPDEAKAFAARLSAASLEISATEVSAAVDRLKKRDLQCDGILMDVDLSSSVGTPLTGAGLAQDIRLAQQSGAIPPCSIVRFSFRRRLQNIIGSDASSDDLFDWDIEKDGISEELSVQSARTCLTGTSDVYRAITEAAPLGAGALPGLFQVAQDQYERWVHADFSAALLSGGAYQAAQVMISAIRQPGILIPEQLLAYRLGVAPSSSGWNDLLGKLASVRYSGPGHASFPRWWARGLEEWWFEALHASRPMAGMSIGERISVLRTFGFDIAPLDMPKSSPGDRPWRFCTLIHERQAEWIPVDPAYGVRISPRSPLPLWVDPLYAALGVAIESGDARANAGDIQRLSRLIRKAK